MSTPETILEYSVWLKREGKPAELVLSTSDLNRAEEYAEERFDDTELVFSAVLDSRLMPLRVFHHGKQALQEALRAERVPCEA